MEFSFGSTPPFFLLFARTLVSVYLLFFLCALCGKTLGQDFKQVRPGVEHARVEHKIGDDPVKINLLRLDLKNVRLDVHHAMDAAIGTEKTSSIAVRHGAIAAINAGFFRLDTTTFAGDSVGLLMIDRDVWSENFNSRTVMAVSNGPTATTVLFANTEIMEIVESKKWRESVNGVNRERKADELIKYTPSFNRTTLADSSGLEIVVRQGKVAEIRDRQPGAVIPDDGFVLSASGKMRDTLLPRVQKGTKVITTGMTAIQDGGHFPTEDELLNVRSYQTAEDIVGGVPRLIKDGKIDITWEREKAAKAFVEDRHPRTAVAKLRDGKFLMVTVDGRQPGVSVGMSLRELAEYLLSLGAVDAMNLDGGGSTTMYLDGKVVNTPSDKEGERKVGDAIVVTLRKK